MISEEGIRPTMVITSRPTKARMLLPLAQARYGCRIANGADIPVITFPAKDITNIIGVHHLKRMLWLFLFSGYTSHRVECFISTHAADNRHPIR